MQKLVGDFAGVSLARRVVVREDDYMAIIEIPIQVRLPVFRAA